MGKIWNFSKFLILLNSEALVPLLCFPKGWKMFVSREDLQTIILSTERPLYHVGELRYGPPKFFEENQKFQKMQSSYHLSPSLLMCLYLPKWFSEAPIDLIWKYSSLWVILKVFAKKKLILSPKLVKNTTENGQNQEKPRQGPFYHTNCHWWLSVQPICTQKWWLWEIGWVFWPNCLKITPELPQNEKNGGMAQQAK